MHPSNAYPIGTVTFLFTDLEGSTRSWDRDRKAMAHALARHDALLRQAIEAHGGHVFKTVGDAFCAAFARADDALTAALAGQRALAAEDWGEAGPLRARMALHAGVAEERDRDYFGPAVNRVARLLSAGYGGQVLLSAAARELLHDALPADVHLRDLGQHRLKDLERPELVFQAVVADLPAAFPPLKTLDHRPNNLPPQLTSFVGREAEVAAVRELLGRPDARLVTLTGPGGTGKTRLALQVAAELVDEVADGVFFVDLAPVADDTLVVPTVAHTLGLREAPGLPLAEALTQHLRTKALLLVLDNFEQVTDAAPEVGALLRTCPQLTALATSRHPLRVSGEREVAVPPLGLPPPGRLPPAAQTARAETVRLFVERAQAAKADFALTDETIPAVAEICRRLDGLPLAIELAAARVKLLPPPALLARLESRLRLLTGGARDRPERQQTLRGAIAWSHDLLTPEEQALFRRLGVFAGGWTLEAAEAVGAPDGDLDVLDGLSSLTDKSLIRQVEQEGGEPSFSMLETIREFALERLAEAGEEDAIRRAHAGWCLGLAEGAEPTLLVGTGQAGVLGVLAAENDNLRGALTWALERDPPTALRLAGALGRFWQIRMHLDEGSGWLARALERSPDAPAAARAKALSGAGVLATFRGDAEQGVALIQEALALSRRLGDRFGIVNRLAELGLAALMGNEPERAAAVYEEMLPLAREFDDPVLVGVALLGLGWADHTRGDPAGAAARYDEALALFRAVDSPLMTASVLMPAGVAARDQGDLAGAAERFREALVLYLAVGNPGGIGQGLASMAATATGQPAAAARLFGAGEALCAAVGTPFPSPYQYERARCERAIAAGRAALGEPAFAAAWEAGRALEPEEAVAEALALADELAGSGPPEPGASRAADVA